VAMVGQCARLKSHFRGHVAQPDLTGIAPRKLGRMYICAGSACLSPVSHTGMAVLTISNFSVRLARRKPRLKVGLWDDHQRKRITN
jgi:hypothetical protein